MPYCCNGQPRRSLMRKTVRCAAHRMYSCRCPPAVLHRPTALFRVQRETTCSESSLLMAVFYTDFIDLSSAFRILLTFSLIFSEFYFDFYFRSRFFRSAILFCTAKNVSPSTSGSCVPVTVMRPSRGTFFRFFTL